MKPDQTELVVQQQPLAVERQTPTVGEMLAGVIEKGVTAENVAAIGELVKLYEHMETRNAEKAFAAAFVALQADTPNIKAVSFIPDNSGNVRSRFAPYEEIMEQVAPLLQKHGFTVTFSTDFKEGRIIKTCILQHVSGHSRSNQFAVRIGSGPPKASEAQADGAASTYAKRFALCDALNIVVDKDTDARVEGGPVTPEQAFDYERRVQELNIPVAAFLKFAGVAGVKSFSEIPTASCPRLDEFLRKREQSKRA